jgi:uncharacterized lipoprotein YajG
MLSPLIAVLLLAGCSYGPEQTVTIEITGTMDDAEQDQITEKLKTMTDGSGHSMSSFSSGNSMTIELAPVSDVQAFADKIDFGEVTAVEGRTVKVSVGDDADGEEAG